MARTDVVVRLAAVGVLSLSARGQWAVSYVEDPSRVDPAAATDQEEKDYAWGDLDRDGDIDLVVVRRQPWTTTGRRANMLLMNENSVLTDRTAQLRVRFGVCDCPNDSVTEAGIDDFEVIALCSNDPCPWDLDGDGTVGINDFLALLAAWGPNPGHPADFDGDGVVGILDFLALLGSWGPCP